MANKLVIKNDLVVEGNITGNLIGTSSHAYTASYAVSASSATTAIGAFYSVAGNPISLLAVDTGSEGGQLNFIGSKTQYGGWTFDQYTDYLRFIYTSGSYVKELASFHGNSGSNSYIEVNGNINGTASVARTMEYDFITKDPSGFPNQTDSLIAYNDSSSLFIIHPLSGSFDFYSAGRKVTVTDTRSIFLSKVVGQNNYVFFDANTLQLGTSSVEWNLLQGHAPIAIVYWDGARSSISSERHGMSMSSGTHNYVHSVFGPRYASGLTGTFPSSSGAFIIQSGHWFDDDLDNGPTSSVNQCRVGYYSGSIINLPLTRSFTNGQLVWNNVTTGATASLAVNQFGAYWIYAINGLSSQITSIMPQRVDTTLANAQANATPSSLIFGNFPYREGKLIYRVIMKGDGTVSDVTDYRTAELVGSSFTPTDHGTLSGLLDDDHPQYLLLTGRTGGQSVLGGITASIQGSSSYALTASMALNVVPSVSASYALSASSAITSLNTTSASYALTASAVLTPSVSASYATSASKVECFSCDLNTSTIRVGMNAGLFANPTYGGVYIGVNAGANASGSDNSPIFIGNAAGNKAGSASFSTCIGGGAGNFSVSITGSTFIGNSAYGGNDAIGIGKNVSASAHTCVIGLDDYIYRTKLCGHVSASVITASFLQGTASYALNTLNAGLLIRSGEVESGSFFDNTIDGVDAPVTFSVPMSDTNYSVNVTPYGATYGRYYVTGKQTIGFRITEVTAAAQHNAMWTAIQHG